MAHKRADWPNTQLTNVKITVNALLSALNTAAIGKSKSRDVVQFQGPNKEEAEQYVQEHLKKVLQSPLNQKFYGEKVATASMRRLHAELKRLIEQPEHTDDEISNLQSHVEQVVRELAPDHPFVKPHQREPDENHDTGDSETQKLQELRRSQRIAELRKKQREEYAQKMLDVLNEVFPDDVEPGITE